MIIFQSSCNSVYRILLWGTQ